MHNIVSLVASKYILHMSILAKIVAHKRDEIVARKAQNTIKVLEQRPAFGRETYSLKTSLLDANRTGIIAEFKRQSPSKGLINGTATVEEVTQGYQKAGASAISILTDELFFGGKDADLVQARPYLHLPILRKDFIIDEYQIIESKSLGADIILLIGAILSAKQLEQMAKLAKSLSLNTLLEVHNKEELERSLNPYIDAVGVNNRNLNTFETSVQTSFELASEIPNQYLKVSESAIDDVTLIQELKEAGYAGFLVGECFMKTPNPSETAHLFMSELRKR